jgi:hypothetical protein
MGNSLREETLEESAGLFRSTFFTFFLEEDRRFFMKILHTKPEKAMAANSG